jgi:hypothetical protein
MAHEQCDSFPDIWQKPPDNKDPDHDRIVAENRANGRVYRAARYILVKDFSASSKLPEEPEDFPGNPGQLTDQQIAQMASVHGLLLADEWEPSMGKTTPNSDDLLIHVCGESMVIDRRFVGAVVAAVQEYTSRATLFNKCFEFLRQQGHKAPLGSDSGSSPKSARPAQV